jgi:hypothetical protein
MLLGRQAEPGAKLPAVLEAGCIGNGGYQRAGGKRSDAEQFPQAPGGTVTSKMCRNFGITARDTRFKSDELLARFQQERPDRRG